MWGVGGLMWGLMIRYLGFGLGVAIGCGLISAAGTLVPPILRGQINTLYGSLAANVGLVAVGILILGIIVVGMAGMSKERELPEAEKKKAVAEFNFKKGILVAVFTGLMSSAMGFGLQGGTVLEIKAQYGSESGTLKPAADGSPHEVLPADVLGSEDATAPQLLYDPDAKVSVIPVAAADERLTSKVCARHARAGRGSGGRFCGQLLLVPFPQREEQNLPGLRSLRDAGGCPTLPSPGWPARSGARSSSASRPASRRWARGPTSAGP